MGESFGTKDTLMNSSPSNSFNHDGNAEINAAYTDEMLNTAKPEITVMPRAASGDLDTMNAGYTEILDKAEADIALLQRAVKRRRKALRRQTRRQTLDRVAAYRSPALIMLGVAFFIVGVLMLMTGQPNALDMFDRAMTAWSAAFVVRPRT
ncbi:hypothetical protein ABT144_11020 [Streptomyces sp. NPDC002039]|uniref:hypothetical protein n=1 Tax=Streptomyces sp. NPDC002039 TaxID=3154660 RepID=UPI0033314D32